MCLVSADSAPTTAELRGSDSAKKSAVPEKLDAFSTDVEHIISRADGPLDRVQDTVHARAVNGYRALFNDDLQARRAYAAVPLDRRRPRRMQEAKDARGLGVPTQRARIVVHGGSSRDVRVAFAMPSTVDGHSRLGATAEEIAMGSKENAWRQCV